MQDNKSKEEFENQEENFGEIIPTEKKTGIDGFIQKNGRMIITVSLAAIILVGLILLFRSNSAKNEANASLALSRIETFYTNGEFEIALHGSDTLPLIRGERIIGLVAIVSEYGSTKAGQRATLFAADSYFNLGDFAEAKKYYEKAIKSNIDVVKIGGLAGTAACNEKAGKLKEAADDYIKAADLVQSETLKLRYMYFGGLCYEKAGNTDLAIKAFRNIINLNKFGEFNNLAKAGIVRLGENIE